MNKPIFATVGIAVCSLAILNDLGHAQIINPSVTSTSTTIQQVGPGVGLPVSNNIPIAPIAGAGELQIQQQLQGAVEGNATEPLRAPAPRIVIRTNESSSRLANTPATIGSTFSAVMAPEPGLQLRGIVSNARTMQHLGMVSAHRNLRVVQSSTGEFFFMSPNGQLQAVPVGTNIMGLLDGGMHGGYSTIDRARMYNRIASPVVLAPMTLIRTTNDGNVPSAVASRSVYVNGYPSSVSGQIIAEYPATKVQSFARVIKKCATAKCAKRKHSAGLYLK